MTDETTTETETPESDDSRESVRDTLEAVYEELEADAEADEPEVRGEGEAAEKPSDPVSEAARTLAKHRGKRGKRAAAEPASAEAKEEREPTPEEPAEQGTEPGGVTPPPGATPRKLDPPVGWSVPDKEAFNQLPDVAKGRVLDFWGHMEQKFTNGSKELARHRQRYGQLDQLMEFYTPRWNLAGATDVQVAAELFAAHDLLTRDPLEGAHRLLQNLGITPEDLHAYRQQQGQGGQAQVRPQQQPPIDPRVDELYNYFQQSRQSQEQQHIDAGVREIEAVRNEKSPDGRYLYPELHNDAYLIERVQPLVSSVLKTNPGLPLREATKRAVHTLRLLDGQPGSPAQNGSGLSREEIARVKHASASVRGRGNATIPSGGTAQPGEKVRDSLEAVWQQLSNSH